MLIIRTILAISAMAMGAGAVLALPGFSPEVEASAPAAMQKSDRNDIRPVAVICGQQAWPYFERDCLRGHTQAGRQGRTIRVIAVDRTK